MSESGKSQNQQSCDNKAPVVMDPSMLAAMYGVQEEDEIDLLEYWNILWKKKWLIISSAFLAACIAASISLMIPNRYQAEVLVSPVKSEEGQSGGLASALGGLGGLASMAGISLGGGGSVEENIAVLKSKSFLWSFIKDEKLMPVLFAEQWNAGKNRWLKREPEEQPSLWDAYRLFVEGGLLTASTDKDSGLVTLAIEWTDADLAASWANTLVERVNKYLRQQAMAQSQRTLKYLNDELMRTQIEDQRKALFQLISQEQKKSMLANTQKQFAFQIIDKAVAPDKKSKPKRAIIVVLTGFVAGFLAVIFVFIQEGVKQRKQADAGDIA